ncbi:MAG: homoserine dehydrogenase [Hyphomicrobiales bacterium]|nr:MAG: homoserine dehydrogenase [Hyphomicrobiales bacterium]
MGIAMVGCGTVGCAVGTLLTRDAEILASRAGLSLQLRHIVDVDFTAAGKAGLSEELFQRDLEKALADESVGVVLELVGGTGIAKTIIERSIRAGKHVVTANKALLAHHGAELCALARQEGVCIAFEASCAGGVPIIHALTGGLLANRIDALYGIVNGTCNYILTAMMHRGQSYADALAAAQKRGLAEADPALDVTGVDSAHKLAILASLAFGERIDFDAISVTGIDSLQLCDVRYGQELGYTIKLLAIATRQGDALSLKVSPAFIHTEHPLAWVSGSFNAISVYGHTTGHTMYYGRGAGGMPTASAVVADIMSVAMGMAQIEFASLLLWPDRSGPAVQLPITDARSQYYIRVMCDDHPGVLARIATILADRGISLLSVLQHEPPAGIKANLVPLIIATHEAQYADVAAALAEVDALKTVVAPSVCIPIVDEHPEDI